MKTLIESIAIASTFFALFVLVVLIYAVRIEDVPLIIDALILILISAPISILSIWTATV